MPKKHMSGFVPIPFTSVGKLFLPVSIVVIAVTVISRLLGWEFIPLRVTGFGIGLLIVSMYLLFVVPEE